jgi:hypothetical protein
LALVGGIGRASARRLRGEEDEAGSGDEQQQDQHASGPPAPAKQPLASLEWPHRGAELALHGFNRLLKKS